MQKIPNPWQDQNNSNRVLAFLQAVAEAFIRPWEYFASINITEDDRIPLGFCIYNTIFLIIPIAKDIMLLPFGLCAITIMVLVPLQVFFIAHEFSVFLSVMGEKVNSRQIFWVIGFSTPAFALASVPVAGYGLAAVLIMILIAIGLIHLFKIQFLKILPVIWIAAFLVLGPMMLIDKARDWVGAHPKVDRELEIQKILAVESAAAEEHALKHKGEFPTSSDQLVRESYIVKDYCNQEAYGYFVTCDLRNYGYYITAYPIEKKMWLQKAFIVKTGGRLFTEFY